jgi:hypothetical protein
VALTVNRLLADRRLGLTLVGGATGADGAITWAHAIELEDPTPWLSGGEQAAAYSCRSRLGLACFRTWVVTHMTFLL